MQKVLALSFFASSGAVDLDCSQVGSAPLTEECRKFQEFEKKFDKQYHSVEKRLERFAIFIQNLVRIEALTLSDESGEYSYLTRFADMSKEEFKARNTLRKSTDKGEPAKVTPTAPPKEFDWRAKRGVNPIQDQAQCGSCWAFSAVSAIEGRHFALHKTLLKLSEQQLVSCDGKDEGCNGGLMSNAYQYLINDNIGLESEANYPYIGEDARCNHRPNNAKVYVSGPWIQFPSNEDVIAAGLMEYGVLSIGINADTMQMYEGGVASPSADICDPEGLDHGVSIVGFNVDKRAGPYWIVRNSWGSSWGESGYYWPARGKGICGLNLQVTTVMETSTSPTEVASIIV